ncbi:hypothetical protein [Streptomyces sp. NPDC086835]|uniref:hypothetical protein n=1 Tax=Streptomyces sp. NPDC086835 TaxID=3365761 RepID=UPI003819E7D4
MHRLTDTGGVPLVLPSPRRRCRGNTPARRQLSNWLAVTTTTLAASSRITRRSAGLGAPRAITGAVRHIGALLAGLAVTWWQHD